MSPCENGCGSRATFKEDYQAFLCAGCRAKLESKASRQAVRELKKQWKERQ